MFTVQVVLSSSVVGFSRISALELGLLGSGASEGKIRVLWMYEFALEPFK